jgi:hopanoid biosynthesis associated protein HpnK
MSERLLIVTGDDFGAAREVNDGIVAAHRGGILTSASLMVTGAAVEDAVRLARAHPDLAVGLHLVLVQGRPAAPPAEIPLLVRPDGLFRDQPIATGLRYAATCLRRDGRTQLGREIAAQFDAFERTGLSLAHVDGHCNMHMHPMVLPLVLEQAARRGVRGLRLTRDPIFPALRLDPAHAWRKVGEGVVFGALGRWAAPRLGAAGIATTDRVLGMHQTGRLSEARLLAMVRGLAPGTTEIYCHPATATAPVLAPYQQGYRGTDEIAALTSATVRAAIEAGGIRLGRYGDLSSAA